MEDKGLSGRRKQIRTDGNDATLTKTEIKVLAEVTNRRTTNMINIIDSN